MRKFLLYSSAFTVLIVIIGIIVIFDVFDFSRGKSQLIGSSYNTDNQIETHNKIVGYVHNIGNTIKNIHSVYYNMQTSADLAFFVESIENLKNQRKTFENYMQQIYSQNIEKDIKNTFNKDYLPAVKDFENQCFNASVFFKQQGFSDKHRKLFESTLSQKYFEFIEKHNLYSSTLNKNRRY